MSIAIQSSRRSEAVSMKTEMRLVGPQLAEEYLKANTKNRPIRKHVVDWLAEQIACGQWKETHQGIAFDKNGFLLDGQHRLLAIVKSGIAVKVSVTTGLDEDVFRVIDTGEKRSIADLTGIDKRIAPSLRLAAMICRPNRKGRPTAFDVIAIDKSGMGDHIRKLVDACGKSTAYFSSAPFKLSAAVSIMEGVSFSYVVDQYRSLNYTDFENMNPVSRALLKQVTAKYAHASSVTAYDVIARGLKVFNPIFKDNVILKIGANDVRDAPFRVIEVIRGVSE